LNHSKPWHFCAQMHLQVVQISQSWLPCSGPSHHPISWASATPDGTLWTQTKIHFQPMQTMGYR
jgi:hypothetical protein